MLKKIALGFVALLVIAVIGITGWYQLVYIGPRYSPADPLALAALESDAKVTISTDKWIVMEPASGWRDTALLFYPGGQVAPEGYAETLRGVAEAGYPVVMVPMPLDLAVIAPNRADDVIDAYPQVKHWVISGHSLGGAMAARYVYTHPGKVSGLLLWDAYPPDTDDLSSATVAVRQIHRVNDAGVAPAKYQETNHLLPATTQFVTLPGGTHMNYGRFIAAERFAAMDPDILYGSLPLEEQHARIVQATVEFLDQVSHSQ
jgi:pimeloyl-ACP methyl ester carboxylesterase